MHYVHVFDAYGWPTCCTAENVTIYSLARRVRVARVGTQPLRQWTDIGVHCCKRRVVHTSMPRAGGYVARCAEDTVDGEYRPKHTFWTFLQSIYCTRPAAEVWQVAVRSAFGNLGFGSGLSSAHIFGHPDRDVWTVVHVDDFFTSGELVGLRRMLCELAIVSILKIWLLAVQKGLQKDTWILNRLVPWRGGHALIYEADPLTCNQNGGRPCLAGPWCFEGTRSDDGQYERRWRLS